MATERVITGKKYRILSSVSDKVWDVISFFTKSSDVWNNNDKNLQTTVGSITGISSSLTSTSSTVAASAAAVKALNDKITGLTVKYQTISATLTTSEASVGATVEKTFAFDELSEVYGICDIMGLNSNNVGIRLKDDSKAIKINGNIVTLIMANYATSPTTKNFTITAVGR